jgi:RNA polymerase-binding transcription factor DksA
MVSTDLSKRPSPPLPAGPVENLPRWRDRLERLWRLQVEEIIELSLAYHEAAASVRPGGGLQQDGPRTRLILARTASAHHALAEVEAALGRIDAASYGICGQCGLPLQTGWLEASPQRRYCPGCSARRGRRRPPGPAAGPGTS